jgi:O-methyltransferase
VNTWDPTAAYLDLLKLSLVDLLGHETLTARRLVGGGVAIMPLPEEERGDRWRGRDWPANAMTMVGMLRLNNIQECVERVIADDVPGDLIETGVWRGGASILMRAVLRAHGVSDRKVFAADSFEGLPEPSVEDYPVDARSRLYRENFLASSLDEVKRNFERYGLLDNQVEFVQGWFNETLPGLRDRQWSVLRLDGDMYESTMVALESLYPSLSPGGFLIVDDFHLDTCKKAVEDFRAGNDITEEIERIDWAGVYWRKK